MTPTFSYAVSRRGADAGKRTQTATILKEPDLALSVQVLQEFFYQATRPHGPAGLTHEQAMEFLQPFRALPTQEVTVELFERATGMKEKFALSYWDAAIMAGAKLLGCEAVYSEVMSDRQDYDGLRVINPFSERS